MLLWLRQNWPGWSVKCLRTRGLGLLGIHNTHVPGALRWRILGGAQVQMPRLTEVRKDHKEVGALWALEEVVPERQDCSFSQVGLPPAPAAWLPELLLPSALP